MKEIPLTRGKFALVDDEDYEFISSMGKWHTSAQGYAAINIKKACGKKTVRCMHRILMDRFNSNYESVDHVNSNKIDNRMSNLRICDKSKNMMNKGMLKNNTTGFKGVCFDKTRSKYKVEIGFDGKVKFIGRFDDIIDAAKAYNAAALKYHGEFARLNEISNQ